jgi:hypothetical protein
MFTTYETSPFCLQFVRSYKYGNKLANNYLNWY